MEKSSGSVDFAKTEIRFSFSPFSFLQLFLIFTHLITKSVSIQHEFSEVPYSKYCNGEVEENQSTETQLPPSNFLRLDKAVYSLGFENPQFSFNPADSQIATFYTLKAFETKSNQIVKVYAILNLVGPEIIEYFSGVVPRRGLRLVKFRPPRFVPRRTVGAEFRLVGLYNSHSGKLCMVGSGSVSSLQSVNVVFNFTYPNSSVLDTSFINGTLRSILPEDAATYFKPVSILGVSRMGYKFTYINEEIENNGFSVYDGMENVSLSFPDASTPNGICSMITWGLRFELDYDNYDCKNVSCSFGTVGDEDFPRFMSIKVVDCLNDGKLRYLLQFSNLTYGKGWSFYPRTTMVAEGKWNENKKRVELVACQLFDKKSLRGCVIRLAFSFPSTVSLKNRSTIVGKIWSTKTKNLGSVSFNSPANVNLRIKGLSYEYSEHEKVQELCSKNLEIKGKIDSYPDEKLPNLRFDIMVRNKKGHMAYGYASPLFIRDKFYAALPKDWNHSSTNGYINVSYVISFTTRNAFDFGGKVPKSYMVEISAEGVYNIKNGVICMIGCKHLPYEKFQKKRSLDCELAININLLNSKEKGMIRGSIKSTRKKPDPLYFEPIDLSSASITTIQARESIWRMDLEITMVLISNTLACIFIGLQLFHVKKNPDLLPFISIIMLVVLTLAHMIPLVLNFEAIFMVKNRKQNVFLGTDQWLEVNEVLVRVITMIAFLLQFRLLQLTWTSRNGHESMKSLWASDKKVFYISCPLYIVIGITAWIAHAIQNSHPKSRFDLASENVTFWGAIQSYSGLILDTFLVPQIVFNLFCDTRGMVLSPSFYIGSTMVRLLPRLYDLYRRHSSSWFYDKIYANPGMDYYSTMWDVVICCVGMICVLMIYMQQRFGGQSVLPKRFRDYVLYQKVPVIIHEQEIF